MGGVPAKGERVFLLGMICYTHFANREPDSHCRDVAPPVSALELLLIYRAESDPG